MLARRPRHRESGSILWLKQRGHVVSFYLHSEGLVLQSRGPAGRGKGLARADTE